MVGCFSFFSPLDDSCRSCRVRAACATKTAYNGFGTLLHPRYRGVTPTYLENPTTGDDRVAKALARIAKRGFTVRGETVWTGSGHKFARVGLRYGYLALYLFDLPPHRVMEVPSADDAEVLTWRVKLSDTRFDVAGSLALIRTPKAASLLLRDIAVSIYTDEKVARRAT